MKGSRLPAAWQLLFRISLPINCYCLCGICMLFITVYGMLFMKVARYVDGIMEQGEGTSSQPKPASKKACERNQLHPEGASSQAVPASKKACARKLTLNLK
uniref:Uncharacterized protein n=1 Tax=Oryza barthii TaxID=65489 RepID=A0A0D3GGH2_9ORYZ